MNDDMFCEECREPFVDPELYCKHQCDDESYSCDYDGECVADNNGVMFLTIFVGINYILQAKACQCKDNYGPPRCKECMEPFIHPEAECKNKCDLPNQDNSSEYQCRNGGKCVDRNYQPTTETGQYCLCSIHYGGEFFR